MPEANYIPVSYDVIHGFFYNLENILGSLDEDAEYEIISHSMGGLYALHLTQKIQITKSVSIATPFSGATTADWARYMFPYCPLFRDVHTRSLPIRQGKEFILEMPWLQLVTTRGNVPWIREKNDTVVSVSSMISRSDVDYVYVDRTHHEVMLDDEVTSHIEKFLFT